MENYLPSVRHGKVCDIYESGDFLLLKYTDRLSAFDKYVCDIENKGKNLAKISRWWLERTRHIIPNHLVCQDGNILVGKKCDPISIEFVVRGYMTGSLWRTYSQGQRVYCGVTLPEGLQNYQKLPSPIITPTTKDISGDKPITNQQIVARKFLTEKQLEFIEAKCLELFAYGTMICSKLGLILVDTKYEFGMDRDGNIILIDELHTCDSSRFWELSTYQSRINDGLDPQRIDKDIIRNRLIDGDVGEDVKNQMSQAYSQFLMRLENLDKNPLKYGCNPHQKAFIEYDKNEWQILNGNPGYINWLDAANAYSLVMEVGQALDTDCVASFKHNSPAGVAVKTNTNESLQDVFLKCRYIDPKSSFGDFIGINRCVDVATAKQIKKFITDGIVAPDYDPEALKILQEKRPIFDKDGNKIGSSFIIIKCTKGLVYTMEERKYRGLYLMQEENSYITSVDDIYSNITSKNTYLDYKNVQDLILANITCKWTLSNTIVIAYDGQAIGIGAGQQSRIDCVKLACQKAKLWYIRRKTKTCDLTQKEKDKCTNLQAQINLQVQKAESAERFFTIPTNIELVMASDAFFPFIDNIDVAAEYGVKCIVHPGGSNADQQVRDRCNRYDMVLVETGKRLFYH